MFLVVLGDGDGPCVWGPDAPMSVAYVSVAPDGRSTAYLPGPLRECPWVSSSRQERLRIVGEKPLPRGFCALV